MKLTKKEIETFQKQGLLVISVSEKIKQYQKEFLKECQQFLKEWDGTDVPIIRIQSVLNELAKRNRNLLGRLYKVSRRFPSAKRLACDPFFENIAKQLMSSSLVSCCNFVAIRFDLPEDNKYLTPIHQDFPYIQGSMNGITIWLPFHDVGKEHGIPSFIEGSQNLGILKVKEYSLDEVGGSGGKSFELLTKNQIEDKDFKVFKRLTASQCLVFDTKLVHRSEQNMSKDCRISVQIRFDDILNKDSFDRNYPEGLYLGESLKKSYPEFVSEK